jgi:glycerol kinase
VETTAMGAAYLAGLAVGYWNNTNEITQNWAVDRCFQPEINSEMRNTRLNGWKKAVKCSLGWQEN